MNIILLGAPGSGKGTQAAKLVDYFDLAHIATGDMLRAAVAGQTPLGIEAKKYMDAGDLVPDLVVIGMIGERLAAMGAARGFILDGFPRTAAQAIALDEQLAELQRGLDAAVAIELDPEIIVKRMSSRRFCPLCGRTTTATEGDACATCDGDLVIRDDDKEEVVRNRLTVYAENTAPLIDYYRGKGILRTIKGDQPVDAVYYDLLAAIGQ
ncbi:MAG: adenylate kinase [Coriobacteriia bacterium]|nr:adenylate kinase [Coriobacteriia bacterium]